MLHLSESVELLSDLLTLQQLVHQLEGLVKSSHVVLFFIEVQFSKGCKEKFLDIFANFVSLIKEKVPPCPSKTPNRQFPSPRSV
jgi:hypothetical protein